MKHQRISQEGSSSCRCSTTSHGDLPDNEKECESNAQLVSFCKEIWNMSFLGPGSEKKWSSISEDCPQGEWDRIAEKMMLEFSESRHPVFCATSPLSRGQQKSKGCGKLSMHYCADQETITTVFRTITSANQLSLSEQSQKCAKNMKHFMIKWGNPLSEGQSSSSLVLSVIKTAVP